MIKAYSNQFLTGGQEPVKELYLDMCCQFPLVKDMNPLYQSTFPINR